MSLLTYCCDIMFPTVWNNIPVEMWGDLRKEKGGVDGPVFVTKQEWITRESTIYTLLIKSFPQKQAMLVRQLEDEVVKAKTHASQTNPEVRELIFTQRERQTNKQTKTKTRCTPAKPIQRWETELIFTHVFCPTRIIYFIRQHILIPKCKSHVWW